MSNNFCFMSFKKVDPKVSFPKMEEEILEFWEKEKIFEKSVSKDAPKGDFVFYEGPPTANGRPGLHHVLARSFKDVIPRYKTMKGYRVVRKAGWDTHGLPVELQVEKALGLKNKQEIENIVPGDARASVIEFNKRCKASVWEYRELWEKLTKRMGYWVDMEHPYVTYENGYIESLWWQLAQIAKLKTAKGESFLYKGHKVVPYCYRCGTALSSHEVAQGYKETTDNSVYVKFELENQELGIKNQGKRYLLAWTTTPWTLPGNVALAMNPNIEYVKAKVVSIEGDRSFLSKIEIGDEYYFAKDANKVKIFVQEKEIGKFFGGGNNNGFVISSNDKKTRIEMVFELVTPVLMLGLRYKSLYRTLGKNNGEERIYKVISDEVNGKHFITTDSGTGIVHIAPAFGEDDANVARENDLPTLLTVEQDGTMKKGFDLLGEGISVKKMNDKNRYAVDDLVIEDLKNRGVLFKEESYTHEYPFCWRCDTPLIYYAKPSWFIRMSELREELSKGNESINWVPEHIKDGRFGEWLRGVKDWAISRERYWGTPIPIWVCESASCGKTRVIESVSELEKLSGKKLDDLHKPYIDDVTFPCECGGMMRRTPEVLDVWFDSGAMPLAQWGYPASASNEEKKNIEAGKTFPADYICEAIDQTRGWFYTLHAMANLLARAGIVKETRAYKNVICLGHILDSHGKKMSKSKGNIVDPFEMFDQYGADALRWLLFSLNQPGLPKRFDVKGMRDVQNRVFRMLWNSYSFFMTYAAIDGWKLLNRHSREGGNPESSGILDPRVKPEDDRQKSLLDRWILSELQLLIRDVDGALENYDVYSATQKVETFLDNLSNWYIRRSRKRFWKSEDDSDKEQAYQTLYDVLVTLAKLLAPFTPFIAEEIYRNLTKESSVHLAEFPEADGGLIDAKLNTDMKLVREIVSVGLLKRAEAKIKVRQPISNVRAEIEINLMQELKAIIADELNAKRVDAVVRVSVVSARAHINNPVVVVDTNITPELKLEGEAREIIRAIQEGRKKSGFNVEDRIVLGYDGKKEVFAGDAENSVPGFQEMIAKEVLATEVQSSEIADAEYVDETKIEGDTFHFWLKKV